MSGEMQVIKMSDVLDAVGRMLGFVRANLLKGLLVIVLCTALSFLYYLVQKPAYKATVNFILEEKSSSGLGGGLSSLASQFGFDIGGLNGGSGMFAGDNILDILKSRGIVERVLLTKVDSALGAQSPTLADHYLGISGLRAKWADKGKALAAVSFASLNAGSQHSLLQDSVLFVIYERLFKKNIVVDRLNKKGSIITISAVSPDQVFSKLLADRLLDETRKLYVSVKTSVSAANVARLESRADSLLRIMNAKSYQTATQQVLDANAAFKTAIVPAETSQRDRMVTYAIYTEVMKNLEASRMAVANQTPVVQLLDSSRYPLEDSRKSLLLLLLIGFAGGILVDFIFAFVFYPKRRG
jgi:uncharacterized protein involved in exopolysaccharide biosynthesis